MAPLGRPPVMLDIVEEHFEELDFLWELREGVIFAPDWNLDELAELEERAEAHLDGLRLAELHAVDVARPHLMGKHKFAATAATFVMMETGEAEFVDEVLKAFVEAKPEARDGIRIGLRHSKIESFESRFFELAAPGDPAVRAAAADVLAFQRRRFPDLDPLGGDGDDYVRILAFGALGRGGRPLGPELVIAGLRSESPSVRRAVLEAAARSGAKGLDDICREAATRRQSPDSEALAFLGVLGDPRSFELLRSSLALDELAAGALRGLGALGRLEAIPVLLAAMESDATRGDAASAFQRITGATDILGPRRPLKLSSGDAVADEFVDDTLLPDAEKATAWWNAQRRELEPARRWQAGTDVTNGLRSPSFRRLPLEVRRDLFLGARSSGAALPDLELERRALLQLGE